MSLDLPQSFKAEVPVKGYAISGHKDLKYVEVLTTDIVNTLCTLTEHRQLKLERFQPFRLLFTSSQLRGACGLQFATSKARRAALSRRMAPALGYRKNMGIDQTPISPEVLMILLEVA